MREGMPTKKDEEFHKVEGIKDLACSSPTPPTLVGIFCI